MPFSSAKPLLRKSAEKLTLNDVNFIIGVALESLKTAQNALNLLKDINPDFPLALWTKRGTEDDQNASTPLKTKRSKKDKKL